MPLVVEGTEMVDVHVPVLFEQLEHLVVGGTVVAFSKARVSIKDSGTGESSSTIEAVLEPVL